jgi:hypothetical protein
MPGYDEKVYTNICHSRGHMIFSVVTEKAQDPKNNLTIETLEVFCINCGMNLEEIRKQKTKKVRQPRQLKDAAETPAT